eukprot:1153639-Rhodomonas_salina.1
MASTRREAEKEAEDEDEEDEDERKETWSVWGGAWRREEGSFPVGVGVEPRERERGGHEGRERRHRVACPSLRAPLSLSPRKFPCKKHSTMAGILPALAALVALVAASAA